MFQLAALIATTALIRKRRRIEREKFYRLPSDVLQVAKVTQILLATENGAIKNLGGKTLDEIDYKDLEFSISVDGRMVLSIEVQPGSQSKRARWAVVRGCTFLKTTDHCLVIALLHTTGQMAKWLTCHLFMQKVMRFESKCSQFFHLLFGNGYV